MYSFPVPAIDWQAIAPALTVAITGLVALLVVMVLPRHSKNNNAVAVVSLLGLAVAAIFLVQLLAVEPREAIANMTTVDDFGTLMQLVLIVAAFLSLLFSEGYLREKGIAFGEFYPLALWSTTGGMLMCSSKNLLMIFVGLELLSISLYVLAGLSRQEEKSEESAIKYFLLGALASGFLLLGMAFVYGASGSLNLTEVARAVHMTDPATGMLLLFGTGLMLIGLSFKCGFAPFHQWTPDVYQGAPTNVTAFMAAASKVAAFGALWRVLEATSGIAQYWAPVMFWIAVLTMTVGNMTALVQTDVKRVLAYSSIAHSGYLLVGVLAHVQDPVNVEPTAVVFYLLSYTLMTIGTFAVVSLGARRGVEGSKFSDIAGLGRRSPILGGLLVVFVVSLIGIPITSGFFGKLLIFRDALNAGLVPLAIVLAINSIVSIAYYLAIAKAAYVETPEAAQDRLAKPSVGVMATCAVCALGVLGITVFYASFSACPALR